MGRPIQRDPDLLTLADAAVILGIRTSTAYELARKGVMPGAKRLGGRWRVSRLELERHFHGHELDTGQVTA